MGGGQTHDGESLDPASRAGRARIALRYDYLALAEVVAVLIEQPGLHVVVTGRNARPELIEAAGAVTEFALVAYFAAGVRAQEVISCSRALMFQGTGSDVGKSLIVARA